MVKVFFNNSCNICRTEINHYKKYSDNNIRKKRNLKLNFVLSEEDKFSWQFSNNGFFNFKNKIPKILTNFNLQ